MPRLLSIQPTRYLLPESLQRLLRSASQSGAPYYVLQASTEATIAEIESYQTYIDRMAAADSTILELAATYDMFRAGGSGHKEATERLDALRP